MIKKTFLDDIEEHFVVLLKSMFFTQNVKPKTLLNFKSLFTLKTTNHHHCKHIAKFRLCFFQCITKTCQTKTHTMNQCVFMMCMDLKSRRIKVGNWEFAKNGLYWKP